MARAKSSSYAKIKRDSWIANSSEMEGETFGKWKVLKVYQTKAGSHRMATVVCTCGKKQKVQTNSLRSGNSKGCTKCSYTTRRQAKLSRAMAIGDKMNAYTLVAFESETVHSKGWFKCLCGEESLKHVSRIKSGAIRSCRKCRWKLEKRKATFLISVILQDIKRVKTNVYGDYKIISAENEPMAMLKYIRQRKGKELPVVVMAKREKGTLKVINQSAPYGLVKKL